MWLLDYVFPVPSPPKFKTTVESESELSIDILDQKRYPDVVKGGQPQQFEVIYGLKSKMTVSNTCPTGMSLLNKYQ